MERRFEGTFQTQQEVKTEVVRLINEEGYTADELLIVTVKDNSEMFKSNTLESVEVDFVNTEDNGSFWEKIKETLSFGTYDSDEAHNSLEEHGVPHEIAEHHIEALEDGEIVLLADSDAPKKSTLSEVNKNVTYKENDDKMKDTHKNPLDEVNSEEAAIQGEQHDVKPTDVDTQETDSKNMNGSMDPSQVQDAREEDQVDTNETDKANQGNTEASVSPTEDNGESLETTPDLTGEEKTVESEDENHGYPKNVAKGVVKPEAKSPLNAEAKTEKDPSEKSEAPESDAKYTTDTNEAGMKEEPSEDKK
ncbi:general stress protein [Marinilactibacillus kalidii]|uniref:general stress protein n=1 Tax=Marinilactibacillus kalidii TaxID=2820274 RepID=UPI001ABE1B65|nr:general stress protein [Marinilactibacillus kalidii]